MSTPSIATLYRMAEVLGTEPSNLLPSHPTDDVDVIRADEGQLVPSSDRPGSAWGGWSWPTPVDGSRSTNTSSTPATTSTSGTTTR